MVRFSHSLRSKFIKAAAASILGLAAFGSASVASAQSMQTYDQGYRQTQSQGITLSQQNLAQFFQSLNIKGDVLRQNDGTVCCTMPATIGGVHTVVTLSLSPDLTKVWMTIPLGTLGRVDPSAFAQLLQQNDTSATFFAIGSDGVLTVKRSFDNIGVTEDRFKLEASRLVSLAENSANVWNHMITVASNYNNNGNNNQSTQGYPQNNNGYPQSNNNDPYNQGRRTQQQTQYDPNDVTNDGRIVRR